MAVSGVNGLAMAATAGGAILIWSGVSGRKVSDTLRSLVSGQQPAGQDPNLAINASYDASTSTGSTPVGGAQGGTAAQNQAIAKLLCQPYGWSTGAEWNALVSLWNSESNWSNTIWNTSASCGNDAYAYGIVQACGHGSRQAISGHGGVCPYPAGNQGNPSECGGTSDAGAQISWGLAYIKSNYGSPTQVPHGGY